MSTRKVTPAALWSRESPQVTGPVRSAGGVYRTAAKEKEGVSGVPLNSANAAVVAAVRLAYQVAEDQIDRSTRLARRLRDTADQQVGPGSDRKALDATERLVMKTLMSGLEWWEGSVAEGRCPVKRLAAAEYQMLGTILGLVQPKTPPPAGGDEGAQAAEPGCARETEPAAADDVPRKRAPSLLIVYGGARERRRPVEVLEWKVYRLQALQAPIYFFNVADASLRPVEAHLVLDGKRSDAHLNITVPPDTRAGRWKAAVCDDAGMQVGIVEVAFT